MFWGRKRIKIVFFDVGGVLIDCDLERYVQICCAKYRTTPEPLQREVRTRVPLLECGAIDSAEFWKEVGESLWRKGEGNLANAGEFVGLWRNLMSSSLVMNEDVLRLCQMLSQSGVRLGILSNAIDEHADYLQERGLYAPFNPCIVSCRVHMRKPDEDIYKKAIQEANVRPSECLFVDDLDYNVNTARNLGMDAIVFTEASQLAQELINRELLKA